MPLGVINILLMGFNFKLDIDLFLIMSIMRLLITNINQFSDGVYFNRCIVDNLIPFYISELYTSSCFDFYVKISKQMLVFFWSWICTLQWRKGATMGESGRTWNGRKGNQNQIIVNLYLHLNSYLKKWPHYQVNDE